LWDALAFLIWLVSFVRKKQSVGEGIDYLFAGRKLVSRSFLDPLQSCISLRKNI